MTTSAKSPEAPMESVSIQGTSLVVSRIGLGLAALGRPGYINIGHSDDLRGGRDVEAMESVRFGDRFPDWPQGCRAVQGAVRSMLVVERLELAERVEQVGQVPDQGTVEELVSAGLHPTFRDRSCGVRG